MAEKDIVEKVLEDYHDVFADIINVLLFDGERVVDENDLADTGQRSQYKADDSVIHEQERDVSKFWMKNFVIRLALFGLENQTKVYKLMPIRGISYDGSAYRAQLLKSAEKEEIKEAYPVVTLVLYFGYKERWNAPRNLLGCLDVPEKLKPYVSDYKINVFEIAWLPPETVEKFQSDFRIIADYFVQMRMNNDYKPSTQTVKHVHEMLQAMKVLTGDNRYETSYNAANMKGGFTMCEYLDRVLSEAEARGENRVKEETAVELLKAGSTIEFTERITKLPVGRISELGKLNGLL